LPKKKFLKLGSFFSDPLTVTKRDCNFSYTLPFSCEIKMILDRKERISLRKMILHNFQKEKLQISFLILEIFVFSLLRPKNSAPETQT